MITIGQLHSISILTMSWSRNLLLTLAAFSCVLHPHNVHASDSSSLGNWVYMDWNLYINGGTRSCLTLDPATGLYQMKPCVASNYQVFSTQLGNIPFLMQFSNMATQQCNPQCLDVVDGSGPQPVIQQPCNPSRKAQYWFPFAAPIANAGYSWLRNFGNWLCMTAESAGGYVDTYACTTAALHQNWAVPTDPNTSRSVVQNQLLALTNPCLTVKAASPYPGATTTSEACYNPLAFNQWFQVYNHTVVMYKSVGTGQCIDGGGAAGNIYQYPCTNTAWNHQWMQFQYQGTGDWSWYMMDIASGLCLTRDPVGLNVKTAACVQGTANQQWVLWPSN